MDAPSDTEHDWSSLSPPRLWLTMTISVPKDVRNPVMIAIMSAIYWCMLQKTCACTIAKDSDTDSHYSTEREDDEVYLRFGGGALADMFRTRYKEMKSEKPSQYKRRCHKSFKYSSGWAWLTNQAYHLLLHIEIKVGCTSQT